MCNIMIFKYLQIQNNVSQAGGREFEPRLPLDMKNTENQSLTFVFTSKLTSDSVVFMC